MMVSRTTDLAPLDFFLQLLEKEKITMDSYYLDLALESLNKAHADLMKAGSYLKQAANDYNYPHRYLLRIIHTVNTLMEYVLLNIEPKP